MDFSWCFVHQIMVFARFCKNVIKTSSRSYTGANYQKCISCGTFIDFQHVWKELLSFSSVGQIQSHLIASHSAKLIFQLTLPSDVTSVVHVTQVNMNVNIPTPPQSSDVTSVVHVTQVNMNVNIPTPPQPSDVTSVAHASISRATCILSEKWQKRRGR